MKYVNIDIPVYKSYNKCTFQMNVFCRIQDCFVCDYYIVKTQFEIE